MGRGRALLPGREGWRRRLSQLILAGLIVSTLASAWHLSRHPFAAPLVDRSANEVRAALAGLEARRLDRAGLVRALEAALTERPADWPLIDSLLAVAEARGLALPDPLTDPLTGQIAARRREERGPAAATANCLRCLAGRESCRPIAALPCLVGIELVPVVSDGRILVIEAAKAAAGTPVDGFDVALATVGLAATVGIFVSGGASGGVKAATGLLRAARRVGSLSPGLIRTLSDLGRQGVRLDRISPRLLLRPRAALRAAVAPAPLARLSAVVGDLGTVGRAMPPGQALRVLAAIDSADEARRMARIARAAGPRSAALLHVAGKARLLRATLKVARAVWETLAWLFATLLHALGWLALRVLRRLV